MVSLYAEIITIEDSRMFDLFKNALKRMPKRGERMNELFIEKTRYTRTDGGHRLVWVGVDGVGPFGLPTGGAAGFTQEDVWVPVYCDGDCVAEQLFAENMDSV